MSESADEGREQAAEPAAEEEREEATAEPSAARETVNAMLDAIRKAKVAELLLSTVSTLASVAYGKLETGDRDEAKRAIDAIDALLPLLEGQVDEGILRDFSQALANLKVAYADAVSRSQ